MITQMITTSLQYDDISIQLGVRDFTTKVGSMCDHFVDMRALEKNQVENGYKKLTYRNKIFMFMINIHLR